MKNNNIPRKLSAACAILLASSSLLAQEARYAGERDTENRFHGWGVYTYLAGGKYEGQWQYGEKDGVGRRDWPDGSRYEGEWHNNQPHGKGIKTYKDGAQYSGDFRQGLRAGKGTMRWTNGMEFSGEWKNDQMDGEGSKRFADGTQFDGHFSKGLRSGWGTYTYADKTRYEGDWRNDLQDGKGTLLFPDGGVYKGQFQLGQPHGTGELTYANGDHYAGQWEKGTLSGKGTLVYAKGGSYKGQWQRGLRNGQGEWVSANGSIFNGPFINDKPHGKGTCTENGATLPCRYEFGRRQADESTRIAALTKTSMQAAAPLAATAASGVALSAAAASANINAAPPAAGTKAGTLATNPAPIQSQQFKKAIENLKQKISLTPAEQLTQTGSGLYFAHSFDKLALAQPPSFSWWSKTTALFSDTVKLSLMRGQDQMEIEISSYKGPGVYTSDQYAVRLVKDGRTYSTQAGNSGNIQIDEDKDGWLTGHFAATLTDDAHPGRESATLENGVFRLSNKRPAAATALTDVSNPQKPLLETMAPFLTDLLK